MCLDNIKLKYILKQYLYSGWPQKRIQMMKKIRAFCVASVWVCRIYAYWGSIYFYFTIIAAEWEYRFPAALICNSTSATQDLLKARTFPIWWQRHKNSSYNTVCTRVSAFIIIRLMWFLYLFDTTFTAAAAKSGAITA